MQTNKQNGLNTLSIVNGQHPTLSLVSLNSGGTVNQKAEAAAVQFGYYGLISPDPHLFSLALDRCISLLKDEESQGHMSGELLTDSHEPIHLRARTSLQLYLSRLPGTVLRSVQQDKQNELGNLLSRWFESHIALLSLGLVPSGPLQGCILLPCARKRGATREDPPRDVHNPMLCSQGDGWTPNSSWPGDPIRESFLTLIAGRSPLPHRQPSIRPKSTHLGKGAQVLSASSPDTAAIPITRLVQAHGGFGPDVLRGTLPKLVAGNLKITYYAGSDGQSSGKTGGQPSSGPSGQLSSGQPSGHWARFGDTQEQRNQAHLTLGVDSVASLWIEYGSGKFSFLDPSETPHPFAGSRVIGEVSWDEKGEPKS